MVVGAEYGSSAKKKKEAVNCNVILLYCATVWLPHF